MSDDYTYYAVLSHSRSSREAPFGVLRHKPYKNHPRVGTDEIFSRGGPWDRTGIFAEYQQGQGDFKFVEIDEAEANRLVEFFKSEQARIAKQRES